MRKTLFILLSGIATISFADNTESSINATESTTAQPTAAPVVNANSTYIQSENYLQNPYATLTTGGGTQKISEQQRESQNFAEQVFADGTWNAMLGTGGVYMFNSGDVGSSQSIGYGANIFGQTGSVAGFSLGGLFTAANPFFAKQFNNNSNGHNEAGANFTFLPANKEVTLSEGYLEYQLGNIVQADIGYIGINNSPWLSMNYYNNALAPGANYQGALVNVYPGNGWLLTGLAFNGAQLLGSSRFTPGTFYNTGTDYSSGLIANQTDELSNGTMAVGANYTAWDNNYNLRLWGYSFENYGNLLYADSSIKFQPTETIAFNIALQGGNDSQGGDSSALSNAKLGNISSNFAGIQAGFSASFFSLNIGYNNIWGPSNAYGHGAVVTPYTYGFATDPLYTTPYMAGLNDLGSSGQAYKISPSFNFLNNNLSIAPAFTQFLTTDSALYGTKEYDFVTTYSIPQVRGLNLLGVFAYQQLPASNPIGDNSVTQLFVSYFY